MVLQSYQNLIEKTSNIIYIVAFGVGSKCPHKIHLNTQCPPPPLQDFCRNIWGNLAQCLVSYLRDILGIGGEFFLLYSVVFMARKGEKLWGEKHGKFHRTRNLRSYPSKGVSLLFSQPIFQTFLRHWLVVQCPKGGPRFSGHLSRQNGS